MTKPSRSYSRTRRSGSRRRPSARRALYAAPRELGEALLDERGAEPAPRSLSRTTRSFSQPRRPPVSAQPTSSPSRSASHHTVGSNSVIPGHRGASRRARAARTCCPSARYASSSSACTPRASVARTCARSIPSGHPVGSVFEPSSGRASTIVSCTTGSVPSERGCVVGAGRTSERAKAALARAARARALEQRVRRPPGRAAPPSAPPRSRRDAARVPGDPVSEPRSKLGSSQSERRNSGATPARRDRRAASGARQLDDRAKSPRWRGRALRQQAPIV